MIKKTRHSYIGFIKCLFYKSIVRFEPISPSPPQFAIHTHFLFLMLLSDVFECIIYFTISKFFFSRACITQVQPTKHFLRNFPLFFQRLAFECVQFDVNTKWTGSKNWRTSKRIERARHCDTMICAHYRSDDNTVELAFLFRNTYSVSTSFRFFICMWTPLFLLSFNFSSLNMGPLLILQSIKLIGDKNVLLITEKKIVCQKIDWFSLRYSCDKIVNVNQTSIS